MSIHKKYRKVFDDAGRYETVDCFNCTVNWDTEKRTAFYFKVTKYRFDSTSLCVGFKEIVYFDALVIDLEEVAVFSCDMTSLGN